MKNNNSIQLPFNEILPPLKKLSLSPPPYPSSFRYIDDFTEKLHILEIIEENKWSITSNGAVEILDFERYANDANLTRVIIYRPLVSYYKSSGIYSSE